MILPAESITQSIESSLLSLKDSHNYRHTAITRTTHHLNYQNRCPKCFQDPTSLHHYHLIRLSYHFIDYQLNQFYLQHFF